MVRVIASKVCPLLVAFFVTSLLSGCISNTRLPQAISGTTSPAVTTTPFSVSTPSPISNTDPPPTLALIPKQSPDSETDTPWTNAYIPVDGFTVKYPSDWVIMPATNTRVPTMILSWRPVGPGGLDGVGKGELLVEISTTIDAAPVTGDRIIVTQSNYSGIMVEGNDDDIQPAATIRRVYYAAEGSEWLVSGYFGDPVSDSNPNLAVFLKIVKNIEHVNSPAPTPTPTPIPTATPTPMPAPTAVPLPYEYLHPEDAIREAAAQLGDISPTVLNYLETKADMLPYMFHLSSARPGEINTDPSQFYPWLLSWLRINLGISSSDVDWWVYYQQQVDTVLHSPECQAAQVLNQMASDSSYVVYWYYVLYPLTYNASPIGANFIKNYFYDDLGSYLNLSPDDPEHSLSFGLYLGNDTRLAEWYRQD